MGNPTKPFKVLKAEGKSHITKAELELREAGEKATITGKPMKAWSILDRAGKTEFERIKELLGLIEKDDALYENIINRYCQLKVECAQFEKSIKELQRKIKEAAGKYKDEEIDYLSYISMTEKTTSNILSFDRQIQNKRKMMLDIEKESIMTIASALRSIPKKVEKEKSSSGMAEFLGQINNGKQR